MSYPLLFLMVLPNLIWILLNRGMWVSDTALYGMSVMKLRYSLLHDTGNWLVEALSISPKPPVIPWVGQFLVPFGDFVGNIDFGLLLVTFLAQCLALIFLFEALFEYTSDETVSIAGCAALASTPLFIGISKQLYAQPIQLAAVCWFIYIMARSRRWDSLVIVLQLASASSVAMLTMMSSPAFCLIPGAVALREALHKMRVRPSLDKQHAVHLAMAVLLVVPTVAWYWRNVADARAYANFSYTYIFAGSPGLDYLGKLADWIVRLVSGSGLSAITAGILILWTLWLLLRKRAAENQILISPVAVGTFQIVIVLAIVSTAAVQVTRYPLPLMGYVALIIGVCLKNIDRRWVAYCVFGVSMVQFTAANASAFGYFQTSFAGLRALQTRPGRDLELVDAISRLTNESGQRVVLATGGLGIYNFQVKYHVAKRKRPDFPSQDAPEYTAAEFVLTWDDVRADVDKAWEKIDGWKPIYIVLMNKTLRDSQWQEWEGSPDGWSSIMQGVVDVSKRVIDSGHYERLELSDYPELVVYSRKESP